MKPLSSRQKLLGGAFSIVAVAWGVDMLTGGPGLSQTQAAPSSRIVAEPVELPPNPVDLAAVIESVCSGAAPRPALPFAQVSRDLFVPTARMEAALTPAIPGSSAESKPAEASAPETLPFEDRHELQGILTGPVPIALIDGALVRPGVEVDGYRLVEIRPDCVVFQQGESRVTLRVATAGDH